MYIPMTSYNLTNLFLIFKLDTKQKLPLHFKKYQKLMCLKIWHLYRKNQLTIADYINVVAIN